MSGVRGASPAHVADASGFAVLHGVCRILWPHSTIAVTAWQFLAGAGQGMGNAEQTLGHPLQIGCQRHWRPIDKDVHHSTPFDTKLVGAKGLSGAAATATPVSIGYSDG